MTWVTGSEWMTSSDRGEQKLTFTLCFRTEFKTKAGQTAPEH